ncbi:hypothetical protein SPONN_2659 [uncultured Candidatus Thioglobus sp.]|nr:hypothetical protein SPONN_2659 [uncultured Candidatus Thioglobus sp.]
MLEKQGFMGRKSLSSNPKTPLATQLPTNSEQKKSLALPGKNN